MRSDKENAPKARLEKLPPLSFDPGEVTASYPVGQLAKDLAQSKGEASLPPMGKDAAKGGVAKLSAAATVPMADEREGTPVGVKRRKEQSNPAVLMAISLGVGGGMALLVLILVALLLMVLK